jgi:nitroimidazol reductase NimA-like FMN-containing flavoprotein (pyridoxamine 5'-phosphate oxidase superfamily)
MRRKDKEINDEEEIEQILEKSLVCRIALGDDGRPYLVPMNFGYKDQCLYLHSASEGRKIEILKRNNRICFQMDCGVELVKADQPCRWGMKYSSVIGSGKARFIVDYHEKIRALDVIMQKYDTDQIFQYDEQIVRDLTVLQVEISELTSKMSR